MKRAWPGIIFLCIAFVARLPILHRSVLDWDESLYFLMAQAWLHGHLPYTTIWDNKPPGIYAIFAFFQALIPGVEAIRIAAVICTSILAWAVSAVTQALSDCPRASWAAGGLMILGLLSNDGLSSNAEPFMDCFTILAILAVLRDSPSWVAGALLGCGFMVKYVCAVEILVVLALLWYRRRSVRSILEGLAAAALPLITVTMLYFFSGKLSLWWECGIASNFRRAEVPYVPGAILAAARQQCERWGTLYLSASWAALRAKPKDTPVWFLPAWLIATLIGAAGAKSFYDHYFLEVLPPLCVGSGLLLARFERRWSFQLAVFALLASLPFKAGSLALSQASGPDPQRIAARELRLAKAKSLYVFDSQPILYALTNLSAPTYYVFPSELVGNTLAKVAGVDPVKEVRRILQKKPQYIALNSWPRDKKRTNGLVYAEMNQALEAHYALWRHISGGIDIYKRK